jgi:hypothetical protein
MGLSWQPVKGYSVYCKSLLHRARSSHVAGERHERAAHVKRERERERERERVY